MSCSIRAVFPTRPDHRFPHAQHRDCLVTAAGSSEHVALAQRHGPGGFAHRQHTIDMNIKVLRINPDLRTRVVVQHMRLVELPGPPAWQNCFEQSQTLLHIGCDCALIDKASAQSLFCRAECSHCGRMTIGSQVMSEAALSPIADQTMKPPLIMSSGLMPKKPGRHSTISAILPLSREPT